MRLLHRCSKVHPGEVCCADRDSLADWAERVAGIVRGDHVYCICQSSESVIARAVRGRSGSCRTTEYYRRATPAGWRTDRPRNAEGRSNLRGEIDSRDIGPVDRGTLTGWAESVTRVAGSNR